MAQKAADTGVGPTLYIAIEQYFPEGARIINDDVACQILPFGMRAFVWARDWMVRTAEKKSPVSGRWPCAGSATSLTKQLRLWSNKPRRW